MNGYAFRLASEEDIPEIRALYEPYVKNTAITFEVEVPSIEEFGNRIRSIAAEYPYIVCLSDRTIIGYAYAHRHMERAAYQWNAELSVYIGSRSQGRGIGKRLYAALMAILELQNVKNVYGGVTSPNEKSEKLHESLGFTKLGTYRNTGYKCGAWHDVIWFEKAIGAYNLNPEPFMPIQDVDRAAIAKILEHS